MGRGVWDIGVGHEVRVLVLACVVCSVSEYVILVFILQNLRFL